jgi:peptide/nickel transport system permease protein
MAIFETGTELEAGAVALPRRRRSVFGLGFWLALAWLGLISTLAASANLLPLADPARMDLMARRAAPSWEHPLGTDAFGRDLLSRIVFGARNSLAIGLIAPLVGVSAGGTLGVLAGYFRGPLEAITVGAGDVMLAFPPLILAMAVTAYLGQSVANLSAVLGLLTVPPAMRVARAATLAAAQREFVVAARALGARHTRILMRALVPQVIAPLAVLFLLAVAVIIVAEGALSFLGLGVPAPAPSWGGMIAEGSASLDIAPQIAFFPAGAMFLTVLAFNLLGDVLRGLTDPRRRTL